MRSLTIAVAAALFSVAAQAQEIVDRSGSVLSKPHTELLFSVLNRELRDGMSARVSNLREANGSFCGFVNAKNNFGAYTGFSAFIFRPRDGSLTLLPEPDDILYAIKEMNFEILGCPTSLR